MRSYTGESGEGEGELKGFYSVRCVSVEERRGEEKMGGGKYGMDILRKRECVVGVGPISRGMIDLVLRFYSLLKGG